MLQPVREGDCPHQPVHPRSQIRTLLIVSIASVSGEWTLRSGSEKWALSSVISWRRHDVTRSWLNVMLNPSLPPISSTNLISQPMRVNSYAIYIFRYTPLLTLSFVKHWGWGVFCLMPKAVCFAVDVCIVGDLRCKLTLTPQLAKRFIPRVL